MTTLYRKQCSRVGRLHFHNILKSVLAISPDILDEVHGFTYTVTSETMTWNI